MADNTRLAREVGAKIKYLRLKQGLSQESLALSCDMNPAFLGHVERGMRSHRQCCGYPACDRPYAAALPRTSRPCSGAD